MKRIAIVILQLGAGIVIGFYIRGTVSPSARKVSSAETIAIQSPKMPAAAHYSHTGVSRQNIQQSNLKSRENSSSIAEIQAALKNLKDIADVNERANALKELIQRWAEMDGRGAFNYVQSMEEGEMKVKCMAIVAQALSQSDPQFLAVQTLTMPNSPTSREAIQDLAKGWAETDAQSALTWAEQLPAGLGKSDALAIICPQLGKQNPEEVSDVISQLPNGDLRNSLISNLASQWGLSNPAKAIEWANTLPDSEKALAMSSLIGGWAQSDPQAAGTFVAQMPPGEMQNQAAVSTALSWADKSPAAAAAWVLQFPDALRSQGIQEVLGAWVKDDSDAALNWAKTLPDDATRNVALEDFVVSTAYWSPDKAAAAVSFISDPGEQEKSMQTIMRLWTQTDPASAQKWLDHLNVSDEIRTTLQSFASSNN